MPKKTRQEKILAELRRLQEQQHSVVEIKQPEEKKPTYSLKTLEQTSVPKITSTKTSEDYSYVTSDLKKTLLFALGAIAFEIILSLTALSGYAKLFFRLF